jgi:hypothetical protein
MTADVSAEAGRTPIIKIKTISRVNSEIDFLITGSEPDILISPLRASLLHAKIL